MKNTRSGPLIAIDASRAFSPNPTGIENYSFSLLKNLREFLGGERVVLYLRPSKKWGFRHSRAREIIEKEFFSLPASWRVEVLSWPLLWTVGGLSAAMLRSRPDRLLVPAHTLPFFAPRKSVLVVHGLEYRTSPSSYRFWQRFLMEKIISRSLRAASTVVAVSKSTARDIVDFYSLSPEKISVIYEGAGAEEIGPAGAMRPREIIRPGEKALLFIGRLEERKNIVNFIKAFETLRSAGRELKLVLAGRPGVGWRESIEPALRHSPFAADIVLPGFVSEEEKRLLLARAEVLLFATRCEGFGLPILEAQKAGLPVVVGRGSSFREVAGPDAPSAAPDDPAGIAAAVERVLDDPVRRREIVEKGGINAERFSWRVCAREIAALLLEPEEGDRRPRK